MYRDHSFHLLHYDIGDKRDLYFLTAIRIMGVQLVGVFVPALLYHDMGLSISEIFLFYAILSAGVVVTVYFCAARVVSQYGTKIGMTIGIPFLVLLYISLYLLKQYTGLLYIIPLFGSIFTAFFRVGFHTDMSQSARNHQFGSKVALLHIVTTLVGAVMPFVGGVLLDNWGVQITMYIGSMLLLLSLIPLFHSEQYHQSAAYDHEAMYRLMKNKYGIQALLTFGSQTYAGLLGYVLWPLAMFMLIQDYTTVGLITMVATIVVVLILYIAGRYADAHQENKVMLRNLGVQTSNWIVALSFLTYSLFTPLAMSFIDLFNKLTTELNKTMIGKVMYELANNGSPNPVYITSLHEIANHLTRAVFCFAFAVLFWLLGDQERLLIIPFGLGLFIIPLQYMLFRKQQR